MQQSVVLSIGLPVALVIIMLGLGLSLRIEDFTRCLSRPWPILVGLVCQIVILPLFCLALVYVADLPPAISVGMMLLAASPGGTSAAIFTHLARGDLALSLILAAATSVIAAQPARDRQLLDGGVLRRGEQGQAGCSPGHADLRRRDHPGAGRSPIRSRFPVLAQRPTVRQGAGDPSWSRSWARSSANGSCWWCGADRRHGDAGVQRRQPAGRLCVPLLLGIERRQAIALSMSIGIHNAAGHRAGDERTHARQLEMAIRRRSV